MLPSSEQVMERRELTCQEAQAILLGHQEKHEGIIELMEKKRERDAIGYDKKVLPAKFKVGHWVYVLDNHMQGQKIRKLEAKWMGPFRLVQQVRKHIFTAGGTSGTRMIDVHVDVMKRLVLSKVQG